MSYDQEVTIATNDSDISSVYHEVDGYRINHHGRNTPDLTVKIMKEFARELNMNELGLTFNMVSEEWEITLADNSHISRVDYHSVICNGSLLYVMNWFENTFLMELDYSCDVCEKTEQRGAMEELDFDLDDLDNSDWSEPNPQIVCHDCYTELWNQT